MARASDRSRALAIVFDEEQGKLEHDLSSLAADLVKIVADNTAKETEAADEASRAWWAAASAGLVGLFSEAVICVGEPLEDCGDPNLKECRRGFQAQGCGARRENPPRDYCLNADADAAAVGGERCLGRGGYSGHR